jgi:Zn-finger nucleic acid-binding protein
MKCQSCQVTIDPKWKNAIEKNECPFCGEAIMDSVLKDLLTEAKDLFTELMKEEYKSSFVDWIRANYSFVLTSQKLTSAEESILVNNKTPNILDEMKKRAEVKEVPKEDRLNNAISRLSGAGSVNFETDEQAIAN